MRAFCFLFLVTILFSSCDPMRTDAIAGGATTYAPVYMTSHQVKTVEVMAPQPITVPGKIYAAGRYIFQNDVNTGIHIIDNIDKSQPVKLAFLKLPLSTEIAVKGHYLYSNNFRDLVVFDITDASQPVLVKRVPDLFPPVNQDYPPFINVSFECADKKKGTIVRWELKDVQNPKCRR